MFRNFLILFCLCFNFVIAAEPTLHICTVATHQTKGLDQLMDSCALRSIPVNVLGFGNKFGGMGDKLIYVQRFIQDLPDNDVIMLIDAYDVLLLETQDLILQKFLDSGHNFIIAGERYCWPLTHRCHEFPAQPTSFRFINANYIAYVDTLKEVLNSFSPIAQKVDDQGLLSAYYLAHPDKMYIDAYCDFFLTLAGVIGGELIVDKEAVKVTLKETNRQPFTVHGNGGSRPLYQEIYDELFLNR